MRRRDALRCPECGGEMDYANDEWFCDECFVTEMEPILTRLTAIEK